MTHRPLSFLLLTPLVGLFLSCKPAAEPKQASLQFGSFIDGFGPSSGRGRRPPLDDLSDSSFRAALAVVNEQLNTLTAIDTSQLGEEERIDWKFAHSLLSGRKLELGTMKYHEKDPRLYMLFTGISDVIGKPGDVSDKIEAILDRLRITPAQLANGRNQLKYHVPRFRELSQFMAENGLLLFDRDLPAFIRASGESAQVLTGPSVAARAALVEYIEFLNKELPTRPEASFAIGKQAYDSMLRLQYLLPYDGEGLYAFGRSEFERTVKELEDLARVIDPSKTWQQIAAEVKRESPEPQKMIEAHQDWVDRSGAHIRKLDLIPIPWKERVRVVPRAEYLRKTSYYGNFSIAKGKDADSTFTSEWMINPYEDQWDAKRKEDYMREHDWGVIIVTAPHETYGGHHVQGLYQMHHPRKIRRENGISIFSEGWGLYNEHLMEETGFFPSERIHLRQLQLRLWRIARVVYDAGMHTGLLGYREAISLMTERVGFLEWAAQLEVDAATASPGYFIGYYTGMSEILKLREDYRRQQGEKFSLRDFHERLLKAGNMPPALMRRALLGIGK